MEELQLAEQVWRLLLAAVAGMVIGFEREWREKAAGFRTLALVSAGSAAFMLLASDITPDGSARVAAGIVTGIGFLGAGVILREHGEVMGLTTAATVWMAAALGMAAASGEWVFTLVGLALSLVVLLLSPLVDLTPLVRDTRLYTVVYLNTAWDSEALSRTLREAGLSVTAIKVSFEGPKTSVVWRATGRPDRHERAIESLVLEDRVSSVEVG